MHPRPYLTRFLQRLAELSGKVEVALHTTQSAEFLSEVLKWIDGKGRCKHLFHGVKYKGEYAKNAIVTGKLSKDIETIYAQVQGRKAVPKPLPDVRNALREAGQNYDQAEDMQRGNSAAGPDSIRIQ